MRRIRLEEKKSERRRKKVTLSDAKQQLETQLLDLQNTCTELDRTSLDRTIQDLDRDTELYHDNLRHEELELQATVRRLLDT